MTAESGSPPQSRGSPTHSDEGKKRILSWAEGVRVSSPAPASREFDPHGPECSHCGAHDTSIWRRSSTGELLCNKCGVYQRICGRPRPLPLKRNQIHPRSECPPAAQMCVSPLPEGSEADELETAMVETIPADQKPLDDFGLLSAMHRLPAPLPLSPSVQSTRHKHDKGKSRSSMSTDSPSGNQHGPECSNCFTHSTPFWRMGKTGEQLCNACGLYERLYGGLPAPRPLSPPVQSTSRHKRKKGKSRSSMSIDSPPGNQSAPSPNPQPITPSQYSPWVSQPAKYICQVVHECEPPASASYFSFPFFTLRVGEFYDILQEAGHPSVHPGLPLCVDEGEDSLLMCRDGNGSIGWALARFLKPL